MKDFAAEVAAAEEAAACADAFAAKKVEIEAEHAAIRRQWTEEFLARSAAYYKTGGRPVSDAARMLAEARARLALHLAGCSWVTGLSKGQPATGFVHKAGPRKWRCRHTPTGCIGAT